MAHLLPFGRPTASPSACCCKETAWSLHLWDSHRSELYVFVHPSPEKIFCRLFCKNGHKKSRPSPACHPALLFLCSPKDPREQHNPPAIQRDRGATFRPGVQSLGLPRLSTDLPRRFPSSANFASEVSGFSLFNESVGNTCCQNLLFQILLTLQCSEYSSPPKSFDPCNLLIPETLRSALINDPFGKTHPYESFDPSNPWIPVVPFLLPNLLIHKNFSFLRSLCRFHPSISRFT